MKVRRARGRVWVWDSYSFREMGELLMFLDEDKREEVGLRRRGRYSVLKMWSYLRSNG